MTTATLTLAPDPVLPHRDVLMDAGLVRARLTAALRSGPVQECEQLRAKYRIGESLRVLYRVRVDGRDQLVSARMFRAGRAGTEAARGEAVGAVLDQPIETVYWRFPADRRLTRLAWLDAVPADLREVFGEPWLTSLVAAYSPEKAATARCLSSTGRVLGYAKTFHADLSDGSEPQADPGAVDALRSQAILTALRDGLPTGSPLQLARPLGYRAEHGVSLYSAVPGVPLSAVGLRPPVLVALGAALAVLHRRPTTALTALRGDGGSGTRLRPARIHRSAELIGLALPEQGGQARRLADLLVGSRPTGSAGVHLHGDLHPANVLVHGDGVGLVDLDQAGIGPAAADLGPLLARIWCPPRDGGVDPATAVLAGAALLDGYGRGRPDDAELTWYAAAALLVERALRAVNGVRPDGLAQLGQVLAAGISWLEGR